MCAVLLATNRYRYTLSPHRTAASSVCASPLHFQSSMERTGPESGFFAVKDRDSERKRRRAEGSVSSDDDVPAAKDVKAQAKAQARAKLPTGDRGGGGSKPAMNGSGEDIYKETNPNGNPNLSFNTLEHFSSKIVGGSAGRAPKGKGKDEGKSVISAKSDKDVPVKGAASSVKDAASSVKDAASSFKDAASSVKDAATTVATMNAASHDPFLWLKKRDLVVWAKMSSFPPWPARFCSTPEVERLEKSSKLRKGHQAVVFLGLTRSMAWVPDSGITEFTSYSFGRTFNLKFFQKERDYQASVIEAVRRTQKWYAANESDDDEVNSKAAFDQEVIRLVQSISEFEWERDDCCYVCYGTELSGTAVVCDHTSGPNDESVCSNESHLQCLATPVIEVPEERPWFCDYHCEMHNIPKGSFQAPKKCKGADSRSDEEGGEEEEEEEEEERNRASKKGKKERNNSLGLSSSIVSFAKRAAKEGSAAPPAVLEPLEEESEDNCFVCGEAGRLVLCDFAHCRKAYHHSCVLKTSPLLVDSCNSSLSGASISMDGSDDLWFCPRHTCASCSAVQVTKHPLQVDEVPRYLLGRLQGGSGLVQKPLVECEGCPLSLCRQCEADVAAKHANPNPNANATPKVAPIFRVRKTLIGDKKRMCICCQCIPEPGDAASSGGHIVRLAKLMEAALSRVLTSRLALPYLRPLLPGVYAPSMQEELEQRLAQPFDASECVNSTLVSFLDKDNPALLVDGRGSGGPKDLLETMDNIRLLKYSSSKEFFADLLLLRRRAACVLDLASSRVGLGSSSRVGLGSSSRSRSRSALLDSLDSVLSDIRLFVGSRGGGGAQQPAQGGECNVRLLGALFRLSCENSCADGNGSAANISVQPRSRLLWEEFVSKGLLFARNRGPADPYAVSSLHTRAVLNGVDIGGCGDYGEQLVINEHSVRRNGKRLLNSLAVEEVVGENDVAGCLLALSTHRDNTDSPLLDDDDSSHSDFASDPLELLSGVQRQVVLLLELQASLKKSYTESVLSASRLGGADDTVLELGKASVLREIRLSNEILLEKISLKDALISANDAKAQALLKELRQLGGH